MIHGAVRDSVGFDALNVLAKAGYLCHQSG
eukprot:COSAG01_NODE_62836_length_282_cov_1.901639_2_plen_29_part_01